jgi:hypothetical protein
MSVTRTTDIRYSKVIDRQLAQTYFVRGMPALFHSISDNDKYTPELIAQDIKKRIEAVMADPSVNLEVVIMIDEQFQ